MNESDPISAREQLAAEISAQTPFPYAPLAVSPWVAMSMLQKAIRRGHEDFALRAAATLLDHDPDRLWRRSGLIAFEDVGLGSASSIPVVLAGLAGKRVRSQLGGEWAVASTVVARMARAPKCRAADDLRFIAETHPAYASARQELAFKSLPDLISLITASVPLPVRALALWFAVGTDRCRSAHLPVRQGEPQAVFAALSAQVPLTIVEPASAGFRRTRDVLCGLVPLLWLEPRVGDATYADDPMPPETMIGPAPGWALDMFTREGRRAFQVFLQGNAASARWVRDHIPEQQRVRFLGGLVFCAEGGLVRSRLRWKVGDELRRMMDIECHGPHCADATEVLPLMEADIPHLNEVRANVC